MGVSSLSTQPRGFPLSSEPAQVRVDQLEGRRRGALVERVAELRLVRDAHRRLEHVGQRGVVLEHGRLVGPLDRPQRANLREHAGYLRDPDSEQVEEHLA